MKRPLPFHSSAVWPPPLLVATFAIPYGLLVFGFWLIERATPGMDDTVEMAVMRALIVGMAAGVYAVYRLWKFHPACNPAYRGWLKLTPWTAARPLPLGPVHPVWQDAAVIGLLVVGCSRSNPHPLLPALVFAFVYLAGLTLLLAVTRRWWHCLVLGFLWPSLMLPGLDGLPDDAVMAAIVLVIWHGHRQSLKAFPWESLSHAFPSTAIFQTEICLLPVNGQTSAGTQSNLGWPYMALSPKIKPAAISVRRVIALGTLFGWWSYCVLKASQLEPVSDLILMFAILAALTRFGIYCSGVATPFNLWGRIASRRIIVPGFDQIFLTPLAVIATAILGSIATKRSGAFYPEAEAMLIAAIWCLLLGGGPSLRSWLLTGQHRLRPNRSNANKQSIRPI